MNVRTQALGFHWTLAIVLLVGLAPFGRATAARAGDADDPYACEIGMFAETAKAIGFAGDDALWGDSMFNACRYDPGRDSRIIVALTYLAGEEKSGQKSNDDSKFMRDLDVVVLEPDRHTVMAHAHEDTAIEDGGARLEGITIDTARYMLAPGLRAFGVSVNNETHCTCANNSSTNLKLYVQHGHRLDNVATIETHSWQAGYEMGAETPAACTSTAAQKKTVVNIAKTSSHGLADLQLVTTVTGEYDFDEDPSKCPAIKPTKTITTLHFDGTTYK
ncbi:hypothetical protein J2T07_001426 [Luteibacter jiangsuensis]|uniref:Uncharacterized protein n=1 Tax=Luteibacter jiangsuensis TaxID=637577 RepID=A0ABT9SXI0_9GAMM|nr:hypothetical protein [Luteibacter jiangsuensis]MDQ0009249.1 hypothetical protein [Luteibacter jiangsuensis]